jgi:hypothetical protein
MYNYLPPPGWVGVLIYLCTLYDSPTTYLHIVRNFGEPFKNSKIDGKKINAIEFFCCLIYNNDDIVLDTFSMLKSHVHCLL